MAIIAINDAIGSRGTKIGRFTAEHLGYRFLTRNELVAETSRRYKVTPEQLVVVDERRPSFWERLKTDSERFFSFFQAVVLSEMAQDRLIVVSSTVAHLLPVRACGLRLRVVGAFSERVREVAERETLTPVVAERRIREADRELRARIQTLLGVDTEDPLVYDMVINSSGMPFPMLINTLAVMAREIDSRVTREDWQRMRDISITAQVRAACHAHPKIGNAQIQIQCIGGAVQLNGPGLIPPWDGLVRQVARQVDGVESVKVVAEGQPMPVRPT